MRVKNLFLVFFLLESLDGAENVFDQLASSSKKALLRRLGGDSGEELDLGRYIPFSFLNHFANKLERLGFPTPGKDKPKEEEEPDEICVSDPTSSKEEASLRGLRIGANGEPEDLRIVGGHEVREGIYNFIVSLKNSFGRHYCAGSVISKYWIVSAAHCIKRSQIDDPTKLVVTVREHNIQDKNTANDRSVRKIIQHPKWDRSTFQNDIALLKLTEPLDFKDPLIERICLDKNEGPVEEGEKLVVAGWGRTIEDGKLAPTLRAVEVPTISNEVCKKQLAGKFFISNKQICAGYSAGGKDACQGDSGGPIFDIEKKNFTLIGLVSAGIGCARPNLPGIYTRISMYLSWIRNTLEKN